MLNTEQTNSKGPRCLGALLLLCLALHACTEPSATPVRVYPSTLAMTTAPTIWNGDVAYTCTENAVVAQRWGGDTALWRYPLEGRPSHIYWLEGQIMVLTEQDSTAHMSWLASASGQLVAHKTWDKHIEYVYPLQRGRFLLQEMDYGAAKTLVYDHNTDQVVWEVDGFWGLHPPTVQGKEILLPYLDNIIYRVDEAQGQLDTCCMNADPRYRMFSYRLSKGDAQSIAWVVGDAKTGEWDNTLYNHHWLGHKPWLAKEGDSLLYTLDTETGTVAPALTLPFGVDDWASSRSDSSRWLGWAGDRRVLILDWTSKEVNTFTLEKIPINLPGIERFVYFNQTLEYHYQEDLVFYRHQVTLGL